MDGLAGGFGLDLAPVAVRTPGLGVRRFPPTMLLCPTPHYAVTVTGTAANATASMALDCDNDRTATVVGGVNWMMAKSSSIAELRLKAQQYAATLDMR